MRQRFLAELEQWWPELENVGMDFRAQRLTQVPESAIENYHVYVDNTGEIIASFTGKKIRTLPPRYGHCTALETTSAFQSMAPFGLGGWFQSPGACL